MDRVYPWVGLRWVGLGWVHIHRRNISVTDIRSRLSANKVEEEVGLVRWDARWDENPQVTEESFMFILMFTFMSHIRVDF